MASIQLGYCTNVHAGANLLQTQDNLQTHAVAVKSQFSPEQPMPVGLWLSASTARTLIQEQRVSEFAEWLEQEGLLAYTLNGFPYGDFHSSIVKHQVYSPRWDEEKRLEYTLLLVEILHELLPEGNTGSISTLPIAWSQPTLSPQQRAVAANHLQKVAKKLAELEQRTGRMISLCIEPEPGCFLQYSEDIVRFFENDLLAGENKLASEEQIRRHIQVCHDVCHAVVMFEDQAEVLQRYVSAGIGVGKVQISSAVIVPFAEIPAAERAKAVEQLTNFAEDRYLHQTCVQTRPGLATTFWEDLPKALADIPSAEELTGSWRVHFHVPVYLEEFGLLKTSRPQILECIQACRNLPVLPDFEVETYAWGVLPEALRPAQLAEGIAQELDWCAQTVQAME